MKNPENIAIKRLKRRRLLARRMKCHGSKESCASAHPSVIKQKKKEFHKAIEEHVERVKYLAPQDSWRTKLGKFLKLK